MKISVVCPLLMSLCFLMAVSVVGVASASDVTITQSQPAIPAFLQNETNPIIRVCINSPEGGNLTSLTAIKFSTKGTTRLENIKWARLYEGTAKGYPDKHTYGKKLAPDEELVFSDKYKLKQGANYFWLSYQLRKDAKIEHLLDARCTGVQINRRENIEPTEAVSPDRRIKIAVALRTKGQDKCHTYRIPGLATTNKGTLIAVYDNRYRGSGDLPGDIDVGMSRSTDGGQTWDRMKVIMDMGDSKKWSHDGIGDPAVLVDRKTNTIWVAALWSHGNRGWRGSGPGMKPKDTGQFVLVKSEDDGKTWSKPINITEQVKNEDWRLFFNGPGNGITMKDGTLVFPAQYRAANGKPWSTLIYSKDRGETWHSGVGVKSDTTEAQLVELADGSIMINCRDNRGGSRTVATTRDLGATWQLHSSDRDALIESVCMASLIRIEHPAYGNLLFFSNPATTRGRHSMTVKVSDDEGVSWPESGHLLYDERGGFGYSCMTRVDRDHVAVLYEGSRELYFIKFHVVEIYNMP